MNNQTPRLQGFDPRGFTVRNVEFYREAKDQALTLLVESRFYDVAGRKVACLDARQSSANLFSSDRTLNNSIIFSLSADELLTQNVDSGWRITTRGVAGEALIVDDAAGNRIVRQYDEALRVSSVSEQTVSTEARIVERLEYGSADASNVVANLAGRLFRHDHPGGCSLVIHRNIFGAVTGQNERLLAATERPDWPQNHQEREALMVPGVGESTFEVSNACGEWVRCCDARGHQRSTDFHVSGKPKAVRLLMANDPGAERVLVGSQAYDAAGNLISAALSNGVMLSRTHAPSDNRLMAISARRQDATYLQDLRYIYDPVGNITGISDDAQPVRFFSNQRVPPECAYRYDTLNRLVEASGWETAGGYGVRADSSQVAAYVEYYQYDKGANLVELRHVGACNFTRRWGVSRSSNRSLVDVAGVIPGEEEIVEAFDACGNLRKLQPGQSVDWNARNQLSRVCPVSRQDGADDEELYTYSARGLRLAKFRFALASGRRNRDATVYLPGIKIFSINGEETRHSLSIDVGCCSVRVEQFYHANVRRDEDQGVIFGLPDHGGSITLELDDQAALVSQEQYYPFGGTAWWATSAECRFSYKTLRFSGKERDATGMYDFGHRSYAPWLRRWISPDPLNAINGLNLYAFCGNNPVCRVDHDGLMWEDHTSSDDHDARDVRLESVLDAFLEQEPQLRREYGLPALQSESDIPSSIYSGLTSLASDSGSSSSNPPSPGSPGEVADSRVDLPPGLDAADYRWNSKQLLQRESFAKTVYRADMRSIDDILQRGFFASSDYGGVSKMMSGDVLIVAETLEGAVHYARAGGNPKIYNFYAIDAQGIPGVSINENWVLNETWTRQHLEVTDVSADKPVSLEDTTGEANLMFETHIGLEALNADRVSRVRPITPWWKKSS